jgi:4-hydroxybenzoate polyprenyltransferase
MARHTIPDITERAEPRRGHVDAPVRPLATSLVLSLRPSQWTKNLIVFAALIGGQRLLDARAVLYSIGAFAIFCVLSGVVYLVNDVMDRDADRNHPTKCLRPIASGALPVSVALTAAFVLGACALGAAYWLRPAFAAIGAVYLALLASYSGPLKHIVIIDVLTIAVGFVLRAAAGAAVIAVPISHGLLFLTILLALFLALSKRRHELVLLADGATTHRRILQEYSPYLLDQMIAVVTASTIVAYAFYTVSPEIVEKFHTNLLGLTLPFPLYGIFRYLYLVHQKEGGGSPAEMLLTDRPLLACVALWALVVVFIIYGPVHAVRGLIS